MMKRIGTILLLMLLAVIPARAQLQIVTATVAITNAAGTAEGETLTVNGVVRTWRTTIVTPIIDIQATNDPGWAATNLYRHLVLSPFHNPDLSLSQSGTNGINLGAAPNGALSVTLSAGWGTVVFTTNSLGAGTVFRVPYTAEGAAQQTNVTSGLVSALSANTVTNAIPFTAPAMRNFTNVGGGNFILATNGTGYTNTLYDSQVVRLGGTVSSLTNGGYLNPTLTNGINRGNAFSSRGNNVGAEQIGSGAIADGIISTAVGSSAQASNTASTAIGGAALATDVAATAIGQATWARAPQSTSVGASALIAATHTNSTALGVGAASTSAHQVRLGTSLESVSIPGNLQVDGVISNITAAGLGNFQSGSDIAFGRYSLTTLANGNNAGLAVGTNVFVEVSGPSAAFAVNGIAGGRNGKWLVLLNRTGQAMTIANQSGVDGTPANRIETLTGADVPLSGTCSALFIWNSGSARWTLLSSGIGSGGGSATNAIANTNGFGYGITTLQGVVATNFYGSGAGLSNLTVSGASGIVTNGGTGINNVLTNLTQWNTLSAGTHTLFTDAVSGDVLSFDNNAAPGWHFGDTVFATAFSGPGSAITALGAANISAGQKSTSNWWVGQFTGDGGNLTNITATKTTYVADISTNQIPGSGVTNAVAQATHATNADFAKFVGDISSNQLPAAAITNAPWVTSAGLLDSTNHGITVNGTANRVTVSGSPAFLGGTVTLSGPQDLAISSSPTFSGLKLSGLSPSKLARTDSNTNVVSASVGTGLGFDGTTLTVLPLANFYGAKGDINVVNDVSATNGVAIVNSASASFTSADVGKAVCLYMGVYTPKAASLTSGSPTMTVANTNGLVVGFGVGGYGVPTNTTISAMPNSTTVTLSKNATANATSELYGFYPPWIVSTIASRQSATQVTLADNSTITTTGLRMVYGTDNTTAIQNANNAVGSGGLVDFTNGAYMISGGLQNPTQQNSVITLPYSLSQVTAITYRGAGSARGQSGFNGDAAPLTGTVLFCPTKASGTLPAIIGGNGTTSTSPLHFKIEHMTVRTPKNPVISHINMLNVGSFEMDDVLCDSDYAKESDERLPTQNVPAVIGPNANSAAIFQIDRCEFDNVGVGIATSIHAEINRCQFGVCRKAIDMWQNDVNIHASHIVGCQQDIVNDSTQASSIYGDCEFEDYATGTGNIVCTDSFSEKGDQSSGVLQGVFVVHKEGNAATVPVNFTSTTLHVIVLDSAGNTTTAYNPINVSQKLYSDMTFRARVAGDTTGMQFADSSGSQLGYIDSNENFNQFFLSAASGKQLILKSGGNGITVLTSGNVGFDKQLIGDGGGLTNLTAGAISGGVVNNFYATNLITTNLYVSNVFATNINVTTFNGKTTITTNLFASNIFSTNITVVNFSSITNSLDNLTVTNGFTNLAATASTMARWDANKKLGSLANGGANVLLHGTTPPAYSAVDLSADVTGSLPEASVSSLVTDLSQRATTNDSRSLSFSGSNWLTGTLDLEGELRVTNAVGTTGQVLTSAGSGKAPYWTTPAASGFPSVAGSTNLGNGFGFSANVNSSGGGGIFAVPSTGMYSVLYAQNLSNNGSDGHLATTLTWTDELGGVTATIAPDITGIGVSGSGRSQGVQAIYCTSGSTISMNWALSNMTGSGGTSTAKVHVYILRIN